MLIFLMWYLFYGCSGGCQKSSTSKYIDVCLFDIGVNAYEFRFYIEDRKKFKDLICNF